ncbi:arabinan endo-1,5-alpha-L-arabinosidase [Spinactinospora alkalitolerans]|uniref:Arabinan endo-1,5-alpha-L-arabinosidase n=1 Tax=Spinactinospora alkalitolerans TaxID=687207 RepID=A0A852U245_9ACTN|nr:arabinan endo-1,5-alpha-L-arabinosidase [Spinactinospora alkalitolerans]NYE49033.1 arabinan endo-1,5-alpha-L-arabinosidase [Spinactinospora alkalitolerans]
MAGRIPRLAAVLTAGLLTLALAPAANAAPAPTGPKPHRLSGDVRVHDPALVAGGGGDDWYVFGTGDPAVSDGNIQIRSSRNGREWTYEGAVWEEKPAWLSEEIPGVTNLWAPEIHEDDGTYYLYYSASTFGSNRSLIGLATNTTLDPDDPSYEWVDRGKVFETHSGDDYNAIDPGIVADADGTRWMAFGSYWSGIRMVRLDWPSGKPASGAEVLHLADRQEPPNAIEAPYIVHRGDHYYLFVSFDACCQGTDSTYKIAVGRSESVTGPYIDRDGVPLLEGGGTVILADRGSDVAAGGQSLSGPQGRHGEFIAYHTYGPYGTDGDFKLGVERVRWGADGWPALSG